MSAHSKIDKKKPAEKASNEKLRNNNITEIYGGVNMEITINLQTESLTELQRGAMLTLLKHESEVALPGCQIQPAPEQQPTPPVQQPAPTAQVVPPVTSTVPTAVQSYTLDQLKLASAPLVDAGKLQDLQALVQKYGVQSMGQLPVGRYGEFATDLRQLGAQI